VGIPARFRTNAEATDFGRIRSSRAGWWSNAIILKELPIAQLVKAGRLPERSDRISCLCGCIAFLEHVQYLEALVQAEIDRRQEVARNAGKR